MSIDTRVIGRIAEEVIDYASRYRCTISDSMADFEFDGPTGGSGLDPEEKSQVGTFIESSFGFGPDEIPGPDWPDGDEPRGSTPGCPNFRGAL